MTIITAAGLANLSDSFLPFNKNGSVVTLKKISETDWLLFGDIAEGASEGFGGGSCGLLSEIMFFINNQWLTYEDALELNPTISLDVDDETCSYEVTSTLSGTQALTRVGIAINPSSDLFTGVVVHEMSTGGPNSRYYTETDHFPLSDSSEYFSVPRTFNLQLTGHTHLILKGSYPQDPVYSLSFSLVAD